MSKHFTPGSITFIAAFALAQLAFCPASQGADERTEIEGPLSAELLDLRISEVESATHLDEQVAATLLDLYRQALTNLERARVEQQAAEAYAAAADQAPDELSKLRSELDEALAESEPAETGDFADTALAELESLLVAAKSRLTETEANLGSLDEELSSELLRPGLARERINQARQEREAALEEINSATTSGGAAGIGEARLWSAQARNQFLHAEIRRLEQELLSFDARLEVLGLQQELAAVELENSRNRARLLEDLIGQKRAAEAERARRQAVSERGEMAGESEPVRELAAANVELSNQLAQRVLDVQDTANQRDLAQQAVTRIEREMSATESKLEIAGLNQALGRMLLENRRSLPSLSSLEKQRDATVERIADVGLEGLLLDEQMRSLRDPGRFVDELIADLSATEARGARDELLALAQSRSGLLEQAIEADTRYLRVLGELDLAQIQMADVVRRYDDFLEGRLLWVRTTAPLGISALRSVPEDTAWLLSPRNWLQFARDFASTAAGRPQGVALAGLLLLLGLLRPRWLKRIDDCARPVGRVGADHFGHSLRAMAYTVLAAVPLPLILTAVGTAVSSVAEPATFSASTAAILTSVGIDLALIQLFMDACRPNGLLHVHCNWSDFTVVKLRGELAWFRLVFPLASLVAGAGSRFESIGTLGGLEVLASIVAAAALAILIVRLFIPEGGILRDFLRERSSTLLAQSRPLWLAALAAVMPLLVALGLMGYSYTAEVLATRYMFSFWVVLGLMVLQGLLARWLLLGYQRLEYEASLERWQAERAARRSAAAEQGQKSGGQDADIEVEEPRIDFASLNKDSRLLLYTIIFFVGAVWLWLIWAPLVPALDILENVPLWSYTDAVSGESLRLPITLADLLLAVLLGIATGAAAKGLPALVEMVLLRRTNMTPGGRYAATTLLRYTIIGTGAVIIVGLLGVSWSKAQWLVAALGVGIGFGLQEIVANFVSGLVILFERPVRVGDLVTIGETSGVVTRIQIRATTIRDFDRKEMLVPNRELITSRVLNWSLTDEVIRVVIPIGVDYGSDVALAMKLAEEAAREHEEVLRDPAPFVIFEEFGDNALNISLRVYLPSLDNRLTTMSELHAAIRRKYAEAGVVFAFPQREVHLHSTVPLDVRLRPAED